MRGLDELNINRDLDLKEEITQATLISRKRQAIPNRFLGKAAIVTGGTAGIGLSIVTELLKEGCKVAFSGRRPENGRKTEDELQKLGLSGYKYVQADMSLEEDCHKVVNETLKAFGRLDYLVNNAFPFVLKGRESTTEDWLAIFNGGLMAYARMMSFSAPHMIKAGGGAIVNVSSISGHIAQPHFWTYNAMKGGVTMLSKSAAMDFARDNIRVNLMSPGHVWTRHNVVDDRRKLSNEEKETLRSRLKFTGKGYMLNRGGEPVECAAATLFLLSDDASYITGSEFMVDGGFLSLGSEGALEKGFRDEREFGISQVFGTERNTTINGDLPEGYYPALFKKENNK